MTHILLTGATGFFGRAVTRQLAGPDVNITCVIREGTAERLDPIASGARLIETQDVFTIKPDQWAEICSSVDMVIHAAWYAEPGKYLTSDKNLDCLTGSLALAQGAADAKVRRFVGIGTCFEYDLTVGHLSPDTKLNPETPYASAKAATYCLMQQWLPFKGVSFLWARLFYLYGKDEDQRRLVPYLHQQLSAGEPALLTSGEQIRDFMDVDDAARLMLSDAFSDREGATNICSGEEISVRSLCEKIADQYSRRDLLQFGARESNLTDPPCVVGVRGAAK